MDLESGKQMVNRSVDQQGMFGLLRRIGDAVLKRTRGYLGSRPWSVY
jgi:hypothetical protein